MVVPRVGSSIHIKSWSLPQLPPNKNCCKEAAIKFSWLPLQRTASISPRRWMDMSNATKVDEQAVSTVRLTPSSPRQKEIRFAAILALDGNGKKVVSTFAFLLLHCWFFKPLLDSTNRRPISEWWQIKQGRIGQAVDLITSSKTASFWIFNTSKNDISRRFIYVWPNSLDAILLLYVVSRTNLTGPQKVY